jgi:deoxyribonuclease IV
MLLGVHCSISGGIDKAIEEAKGLGINVFQVFTKNQRMWLEKKYSPKEGADFREKMKSNGMKMAFSHTTYLLNLASGDPDLRLKSISGLANELVRCHTLGLPFAVLHPGSNKNVTGEEAISMIAASLNEVFAIAHDIDTKVLLENTAGQGTTIGRSFNQLHGIIDQVERKDRLGVCFDTCHAFAAGYDIRTQPGIETALAEVDREVGIQNLLAFHLNDSKGDLGSKLDRHDHIGNGKIGLEPFRYILNNFHEIPKVIETEKEGDMDRVNITLLRQLIENQ